jgi:hypothetical protein
MIDMQLSLQGRVLVTDEMNSGGKRQLLVHPGVSYIEDVLRQDIERGEYSLHHFGMGLGVANVGGAQHKVEILPQVEVPQKFESGNGAVCRQGGPKMVPGKFEKRDQSGFTAKIVVERAKIYGFEILEGAVEILALPTGQVNQRLANWVHMYELVLVRPDGRPPDYFHDMAVEVNIGLS